MSEFRKLIGSPENDKPKKIIRKTISIYLTVELYERFKVACEDKNIAVGVALDALLVDALEQLEPQEKASGKKSKASA